jgi:hypothetical protein
MCWEMGSFFDGLEFEFTFSGLVGSHTYCLSHSASLFLCCFLFGWLVGCFVLLEIGSPELFAWTWLLTNFLLTSAS